MTQLSDAQALTLEAFLMALYEQLDPLPDDTVAQLQAIAPDLATHIMDLHRLAETTPCLTEAYQQARQELSSTTARRSKGISRKPAAPKANPSDIQNVMRDPNAVQEILTNANPVETIQEKVKRSQT